MSTDLTKRTRSQLTVPVNILHIALARSPLKDAKFAARNHNQLESKSLPEGGSMDESEDELLLSPAKNKRASSESRPEDGPISPRATRNPKRAKIDPLPSLKLLSRDDSNSDIHSTSSNTKRRSKKRAATAPASRKPQSSSGVLKSTSKFTFSQRAQSVPLPSEPVRHIDLQTILSSPTRSPLKMNGNGGLDITPLPSTEEAPAPLEDQEDVNMDVDTSSSSIAMSHFTNTPLDDVPPKPVPEFTFEPATPRALDDSRYPPMSPLTPLPPTPFVFRKTMPSEKITRKPSQLQLTIEEPEPEESMNTTSSSKTSLAPSNPALSSILAAPPSRLPRPSMSASSLMPPPPVPANRGRSATVGNSSKPIASGSTVTSQSKASGGAALSKGKRPASRTNAPRRVTRSVSIKDKEQADETPSNGVEASEDTITADVVNHDSSAQATGTNTSASNLAPTVSNLSQSTVKSTKSSLSSIFKAPSETPKAKLKQSSLNAFMKPKPSIPPPTPTSAAVKPKPSSSPSKLPVLIGKSPAKPGLFPTPGSSRPSSSLSKTLSSADIFSTKSHASSLSTLSNALDKLAMPPPSRPNTSMGFNQEPEDDADQSGDGDEDVFGRTRDKGKGKAKDDGAIGNASSGIAAGTGTKNARTPAPLQRSATVGSSIFSRATGPRVGGIIAKMKAKGSDSGGSTLGNLGRRPGMFGLGRATAKASRKTSLPSVMASPVKGGGGDMTDTADEPGARPEDDVLVAALDLGSKSMTETSEAVDLDLTKTNEMNVEGSSVNGDAKQEENGSVKGKEKWPMNSSRRASMALQALSQSLSAMPQTPPKPVAIGTRTGLRSASSTYPAASSSGKKPASSSVKGKEKEKSGKDGAGKSGADASTNVNGSGGSGSKKGSLKLLKNCTIFVDVRTDDGDDAGSLFVDMLRGLGARILGRVGQSCTHIVFKNGLMSTLTRYRLLNDPKPLVVGIAWVVECVEQRTRVDEDKFKIDLDLVNVAGTNKRRRSMLPKHVLPPDDPAETSLASSERDDDRVSSEGRSSPTLEQDPDVSIRSKDEDDLPPLERARRRRSMMVGRT